MVNTKVPGLCAWRRRVARVVLAACLFLCLTALVLVVAAPNRPPTASLQAALVAGFLVVATPLLSRRVDHRLQAIAALTAIYLGAFLGTLVMPAPFVHALAVAAPVLAIVLLGVWAGRLTIAISAAALGLAPLLRSSAHLPGLRWLEDRATPGAAPFLHAAAIVIGLLLLMILLERFYALVLRLARAERQARAERSAASRELHSEVARRHQLERQVAHVGDEERQRLSQEVHDGVCQQLTAALLQCEALAVRLQHGKSLTPADLGVLSSLIGDSVREARNVSRGLCPLEPTPDALVSALRALAARSQQVSGIPCEFRSPGVVVVPDTAVAQHLYRIAQEAISNALRHAQATKILLALQASSDALQLQVQDDGCGIPPGRSHEGMGLRSMALRARLVHGELEIEPVAGGGTRVSCRVPRGPFVFPPQRQLDLLHERVL